VKKDVKSEEKFKKFGPKSVKARRHKINKKNRR